MQEQNPNLSLSDGKQSDRILSVVHRRLTEHVRPARCRCEQHDIRFPSRRQTHLLQRHQLRRHNWQHSHLCKTASQQTQVQRMFHSQPRPHRSHGLRHWDTAGHLRAAPPDMDLRRGALQGGLALPDPSRARLHLNPDSHEPGTLSCHHNPAQTQTQKTRHPESYRCYLDHEYCYRFPLHQRVDLQPRRMR